MKRIVCLLAVCLGCLGLSAQSFEYQMMDENGEAYEVRIKHFNRIFKDSLAAERMAPLVQDAEKSALRSSWRDACARQLLTAELKQTLKQVAETEGGGLWVHLYVDKHGKILTVKFQLSATVYTRVPTKQLKEIYRSAMALTEAFDASCYGFDETHTYALVAFDLMRRAVEEELK